MKTKFGLIGLISCLCVLTVQAEDYSNDLVLNPESVYFSKEVPIVNTDLRIYASVTNASEQDLSGTVKFYDEKMQTQIGIDQPISVLAGSTDDVFVDFTIKGYGNHPIAVRVLPWKAEGDNSGNNKVTKNIFVDYDTDGDGIPNSLDADDDNDGCMDVNDALPYDSSDCQDTDGDKVGNKVDPDDDNDELLDIEEVEKGTDPLLYDTDGDGINDKDDLFPLDPKKSKDADGDGIANSEDDDDDNDGCKDDVDAFPFDPKECLDTDGDGIGNNADDDDDGEGLKDIEEEQNTKTNPLLYDTDGDGVNDKDDLFPLNSSESADSDQDGLGDNADPNDENAGPEPTITISTLLAKTGEEVEFNGTLSSDSDGEIQSFEWNFADGSPIEKGENVIHVFKEPGTYSVNLKVTDDKGESRDEFKKIEVTKSFFSIYLLIGIGAVLFIISSILMMQNRKEEDE